MYIGWFNLYDIYFIVLEVILFINIKESICKRKWNGNENVVFNIFIVGFFVIVVILCVIYIGSSFKSYILKFSNCMFV